jgi:hypothetical protein
VSLLGIANDSSSPPSTQYKAEDTHSQFDTKPTTDAEYAWDLAPDATRIAIAQRLEATIHLLSLSGRAPTEVVVKG